MIQVINKKRKHTKNYKGYIKKYENGYVYRYELSRNQVNNL
jgi:hypothetical protein